MSGRHGSYSLLQSSLLIAARIAFKQNLNSVAFISRRPFRFPTPLQSPRVWLQSYNAATCRSRVHSAPHVYCTVMFVRSVLRENLSIQSDAAWLRPSSLWRLQKRAECIAGSAQCPNTPDAEFDTYRRETQS